MAMTITVAISVEDDSAYTTREAAVLAALQAHPSNGAAAVITEPATRLDTAVEEKAEEKPKAPARAAKTSAPKQSTRAAVLEDTPEPAVEPEPVVEEPAAAEPEEDLVGAETVHTLDDAVTLATKLVSEGKAADVKAALATAGAKRVSELKGDSISKFIKALS